jgi:hypothetical protein
MESLFFREFSSYQDFDEVFGHGGWCDQFYQPMNKRSIYQKRN